MKIRNESIGRLLELAIFFDIDQKWNGGEKKMLISLFTEKSEIEAFCGRKTSKGDDWRICLQSYLNRGRIGRGK